MTIGTKTQSGICTSYELLASATATNSPPSGAVGLEVNLIRNAANEIPSTASVVVASVAEPNGSLTVIAASAIAAGVDSDTFVLDDGVNPAVTFAFDDDASVTETATLRAVNHTGAETAAEMRDLIVTAINAAPTLAITASPALATNVVTLVNDVVGGAGDVAITETVVDAGFTVAGMTTASGTMTVTGRLWGYAPAAAAWTPLGVGTGAAKGVLNAGAAIDETGTDRLLHAEPIDFPGHFTRLYLELTAIGGTATAVTAWVVVQG